MRRQRGLAKLAAVVASLVLLLVLAGAIVVIVHNRVNDPPVSRFEGEWRETGAGDYAMRIIPKGDDVFRVEYRRFYPAHAEFRLEGGELQYSPVSPELIDVIVYDKGSRRITITSGSTGRSYSLHQTGFPN